MLTDDGSLCLLEVDLLDVRVKPERSSCPVEGSGLFPVRVVEDVPHVVEDLGVISESASLKRGNIFISLMLLPTTTATFEE